MRYHWFWTVNGWDNTDIVDTHRLPDSEAQEAKASARIHCSPQQSPHSQWSATFGANRFHDWYTLSLIWELSIAFNGNECNENLIESVHIFLLGWRQGRREAKQKTRSRDARHECYLWKTINKTWDYGIIWWHISIQIPKYLCFLLTSFVLIVSLVSICVRKLLFDSLSVFKFAIKTIFSYLGLVLGNQFISMIQMMRKCRLNSS